MKGELKITPFFNLLLGFKKYISMNRWLFFVAILFCGCNNALVEKPISEKNEIPRYSIISVIHADADYLFHKDGKAHQANEKALEKSIKIAEQAEEGEVFIFHQKPEKKAWLVFPKKDREWYHYKNGVLINKGLYSPLNGGLETEALLYKKYSEVENIVRKPMLMYFGHEIPTFKRTYHQSQENEKFDVQIFSKDISTLSNEFGIIGVSTCNNGNPLLIHSLNDLADFVVASPQNLHLSYLDMGMFRMLETKPEISEKELADSLALSSFKRLKEELQTTITVSIYDLKKLKSKLPLLVENYDKYIKENKVNPYFSDNIDCASIESLAAYLPEKGITTYYRSSAFGRNNSSVKHSGWGCKDLN
mgnify:CR=1 FL=1